MTRNEVLLQYLSCPALELPTQKATDQLWDNQTGIDKVSMDMVGQMIFISAVLLCLHNVNIFELQNQCKPILLLNIQWVAGG